MVLPGLCAQTLPSDPNTVKGRIQEVDRELSEMEQQHKQIQKAAARCVLAAQHEAARAGGRGG